MRTHTSRRSSLRATRMIGLAAMAGLGLHHNTDPETPPGGGGGGGGTTKPPAEPTKPEPTEEQKFADRLKAERAKWEADAAAKAKKEQDAADRKKAEEEGRFKELADKAEAKAAAAEVRAVAAERSALIDDAFADVAAANDGLPLKTLREWVKPKVLSTLTPESSPEDVTKAAKQLAEQYAKDNPRQAKGAGGAPPAPTRTGGVRPHAAAKATEQERPARRFSTLNYRV